MADGAVKVELACFSVLLLLVSAQVVLYRYADHQPRKYGTSLDQARLVLYLKQPNIAEATKASDEMAWQWEGLSSEAEPAEVYYTSDNCYMCLPTFLGNVSSQQNLSLLVDTTHPATMEVRYDNSTALLHRHFSESSLYHVEISGHGKSNLILVESGENAYLPILYASVVLVVVMAVWAAASTIMRYRTKLTTLFRERWKGVATGGGASSDRSGLVDSNIQTNNLEEVQDPFESLRPPSRSGSTHKEKRRGKKKGSSRSNSPASIIIKGTQEGGASKSTESVKTPGKGRLQSLDTFRGFSLVIMVFVNYGGGGYWFFSHSKWNGLTVADLVFPWFVWIMGVSLVFSFKGRGTDINVYYQLYLILKRTVILFGFGLFFISNHGGDDGVSLEKMRISGVLQRLAATYCVTAITEVAAQHVYRNGKWKVWSGVQDVSHNWVQLCVGIVLSVLWLLLTFLIHRDGCPKGYLGPGGIGDNGSYVSCSGGAASVIDQWLLGEKHLLGSFTGKSLYQANMRVEPEGVLGTLTSVVLCILGVQAGKIVLLYKDSSRDVLLRLMAWGITLCAVATLLCLGQKNGGMIPVNKNLWSLSFILLLAGFGYLLLAFLYLIIDVFPIWSGAPFRYTGMNSIMVYLGHEILHSYFPFTFQQQRHSHLTFLSSNLIALSIWVLISYYWFAINFFVKF